ncbi:MAG: hypothetical protein WBV60_12075 [Terriglobales bacterium]
MQTSTELRRLVEQFKINAQQSDAHPAATLHESARGMAAHGA